MHKPSVLHNNNILVLYNVNKHNKAERRFLQHQFFESSLPSDAPEQRVARVVDNERKRDYLGLLAELHDANDPFKLFARHSFRAAILETTNTGISAREAVKSPPVNTVSGDTMRAIAESSLLRGLMLHGFAWAPDELVGAHPVPVRRSRLGAHLARIVAAPGQQRPLTTPPVGCPTETRPPPHLAPQSVGKERPDV